MFRLITNARRNPLTDREAASIAVHNSTYRRTLRALRGDRPTPAPTSGRPISLGVDIF